MRFFSIFKITRRNTSVRALRGGSLERNGAFVKNTAGHVDLRSVNLLVPTERTLALSRCASVLVSSQSIRLRHNYLRRYVGTPHPTENTITISRPVVNAAAQLLIKSKLSCSLVGVTVDCVHHGRSRTEVLQELDDKYYMVGAGTSATGLVNAALGAGEINGRAWLPEDEIATSLTTAVLQDWDGKHKILLSVIPVTSKTWELI